MEILVQLADFFLKAGAAYLATPEGQRELDDIEAAIGNVVGDILSSDAPDKSFTTEVQREPQTPRPPRNFKKQQRTR